MRELSTLVVAVVSGMGYSEGIGRETSSGAPAPGPRGACQIVGIPRTHSTATASYDSHCPHRHHLFRPHIT
jgi:hypothetical protein